MLIYNNNKKLIGIDEEDLNILGFQSVQDLLSECQDIAELFVKKPGYIHDFKNFQWIDFVLHADADVSKAIVQTSAKQFSCDIVIKPFHMIEQPDEPNYAIYLQHIHSLNGAKETAVAEAPETPTAPVAPPTPPVEPAPTPSFTEPAAETPSFETPAIPESEPVFSTPEDKPVTFDTPVSEPEDEIAAAFDKPLEIEEDLFIDTLPEPVIETVPEIEPVPQEAPAAAGIYTAAEQEYIDQLTVPDSYAFDPHVAADELGLPVDLIEEFIGDFIKQSHEFHDELFDSAVKTDFDNVKILSHKLKGVAANLRVEDALEMLTIINNSHDQTETEANLKAFYRVIDKLEGKEVPDVTPVAAPVSEPEPVMTEPVQEAMIEQAEEVSKTEEEDIYSFDLPTSSAEATESPEEPLIEQAPETSETEGDDIYSFDLPASSPEPVESLEEPLSEEPAIDELYAPAPETPSSGNDDLYALDTLPAESVPTEEEALPEKSAPANEFPDFSDEEVELPPMDISLLDEPVIETPQPSSEPIVTLNYDTQKAAAELGLPASLVEELQKDFAVDSKACRSEFEEAIASSQSSGWQACASTLKGAADNLRMTEIAETLRTLTQTSDPQEAEKSMQQLYSYVEQL